MSMLLRDEDQDAFKQWVLPKLETISDADAEVLADYVIALVTAKEAEADIRRNCLEALSDFLQDHTSAFVDQLLQALVQRSYVPRASAKASILQASNAHTAPIPSILGTSAAQHLSRPAHSTGTPPPNAPKGPAATRASVAQHRLPDRPTAALSHLEQTGTQAQADKEQQSRKRKLNDRDPSQPRPGHDAAHNRPSKQTARRSNRNARDGHGGLVLQADLPPFTHMANLSNIPPPPPGVPPFDLTNPMAFMAMAAMFGINMPGLDPSAMANMQTPSHHGQGGQDRCNDYDTKGFCMLGNRCPYEHDAESVPEYDPNNASLVHLDQGVTKQWTNKNKNNNNNNTVHGGSRRFNKPTGGRDRAPFSLPGPTYDRSNTTLVVEQIPEDNFTEQDVRGFFSQFGNIVELQMHAYNRLAIVKYEDHDAASRAYNSPKAIFDNRFVKVYWHRSDSLPKGMSMESQDEGAYNGEHEVLDLEEIERRQAAAQKLFEERRGKEEEAAAKAKQIEEQLRIKEAEVSRLKHELAAKAKDGTANLDQDFSQDLSTLQAEADALFAQQGTGTSGRGRGHSYNRGGYRGREQSTFAPRGHDYASFRGSYRGRSHPSFHVTRSSVKRLDNRPRRVAVADIETGSARDEALRQHLLNVEDCTSVEPHPQKANTLILTFKERYQAEMFVDSARNIAHVGKLDLSWIPNNALDGLGSASTDLNDAEASDRESDATVGEPDGVEEGEQHVSAADADMDVAEDEDKWL